MRQITAGNTGTMTVGVKQMRKLEKDFLIAWVLGTILPALVLGLFLKLTDGRITTVTDATDSPTVTYAAGSTLQLTIPVLWEDGTVTEMELEDYLCGVVLAEMPADFELEALKAQSVVARTYALRRLEQGAKHDAGAVCTDPACCQGYVHQEEFLKKGGTQAGISKVAQAVWSTAGEVLLYDGELIDATYFSCSGGRTEDAAAVWGSDVPYLQSTTSPGEENAAHYSDRLSLSVDSVETALGVILEGDPGDWFQIISYTAGGGVEKITVCGQEFTGVQVRTLLGLRSTNFTVIAGETEIEFDTLGYGHRVGMSQYGADAMAVDGSSYADILAHYYNSTTLVRYLSGD